MKTKYQGLVFDINYKWVDPLLYLC